MAEFSAPKGVPDYFPPVSREFAAARDGLLAATGRAGYQPVELPVFEDTGLFARGVGESTDVVSKEMWTFADRNGASLTLRPEGTAGVMRLVIEHGLDRGALPVKLAYAGPFFRYENPQAGRYRQLQQVGIEAIGSEDPALDAEVVAVADEAFRSVGLTGFRLEITSLGDAECRPAYRAELQQFLAGLPLDEATRQRAEINPLRVLDDKRPHIIELVADAPLMVDRLCDSCAAHFAAVTAGLDRLGVAYTVNPRMVRGLDYYTRTTFEFIHPGLGAQSGIGGGGRYDGLMAELGGRGLSGIGFGLGVDRTVLAAAAEGISLAPARRVDVFAVAMGAAASAELIGVTGALRAAGVRVERSFDGKSLKASLKAANGAGAAMALMLGDRELADGVITLRDMESGEQVEVPLGEVAATVAARL